MFNYRPTIDGLRTIAVFSVVFFHAGWSLFSGGYLGVDIFFVISGYLITRILLDEIAGDRFSVIRFYERRARRILPALVLVVLASLVPAWLWMMPDQLENFSRSIIATAFFGSNFFFWLDSNYFSETMHLKPLFHTWSLAVEEQFYVAFPLMLWWFARKRIGVIGPIAALTVGSLLLAQWASTRHPVVDFYLFPTRGWELGVGALLAACEREFGERVTTPVLTRTMPMLGLALIVGSLLLFTRATPHPGLLTLFPIVGTAMLIWCSGGDDLISRVLASRIMVGFGLISYSLYLWHQVVFAFARLYAINALVWTDYAWLIALSVVLAILSWFFIEQPFRKKGVMPPIAIWSSAVVAVCLMVSVGWVGHVWQGFPSRRPPIEVASGFKTTSGQECYPRNCVIGDPVPPSIALVGDSHAGALANSLDRALKGTGKSALVIANGDIFVSSFPGFYEKSTMLNKRLGVAKKKIFAPEITTVILAGRFTLRMEHTPFDNQEGGVELLDPSYVGRSEQQTDEVASVIAGGVKELLDHGKHVVIVYPIPEAGWVVPTTLQKMSMRQVREGLTTSYRVYKERNRRALSIFDRVPESEYVLHVRPDLVFCNTLVPDRCVTNDGAKVFYIDDDHLSIKGADLVIQRLMDRVKSNWGGFPNPGNSEATAS